jgi:nicotinamidase-related amidase
VSDDEARRVYEEARIGGTVGLRQRPCVLVVDFSWGFTDPGSALGSELSEPVAATKRLLDAARPKGLPVVYTTIGFEESMADAGIWPAKMPALAELKIGSRWVEIDPRLEPQPDDPIVLKKGASAFFGTNLPAILTARRIDSVILCGATTSGCVRATAIDLLQYGYPTVVPRECVGDRAQAPHDANLFDIGAKYADVVSLEQVLAELDRFPAVAPFERV